MELWNQANILWNYKTKLNLKKQTLKSKKKKKKKKQMNPVIYQIDGTITQRKTISNDFLNHSNLPVYA